MQNQNPFFFRLHSVTVQLFSIRAITMELLEDPNVKLLSTLLATTHSLLLLATEQQRSVKYLINNHSILTKRSYFQCTHDLRFVLDHQEVVDELFARQSFRECLWEGWLEIWKVRLRFAVLVFWSVTETDCHCGWWSCHLVVVPRTR